MHQLTSRYKRLRLAVIKKENVFYLSNYLGTSDSTKEEQKQAYETNMRKLLINTVQLLPILAVSTEKCYKNQ